MEKLIADTKKHQILYKIREIAPADIPSLERFLYLAIHVPEGQTPPPLEIISLPEIHHYIGNFGRADDFGYVAEVDGELIGAAWVRILADPAMPGYGNVDDQTPELAISVEPAYRGRGIGTRLLQRLHEELSSRRVKQISLSVQKTNPARRLYERVGYQTEQIRGEDLLMVKSLGKI